MEFTAITLLSGYCVIEFKEDYPILNVSHASSHHKIYGAVGDLRIQPH
jgi:hypothetical protein